MSVVIIPPGALRRYWRASATMSAMRVALPVVLVALLATPSNAVEAGEVELLTSMITASLSKSGIDVISSADVKRMMDLEGERQALGCSETSCLAELADAMGAQHVVYGDIGTLGTQTVLTLNLFDSSTGAAPGREVVVASSVDDLTARVPDATRALLSSMTITPAVRPRVVVVGLQLRSASSSNSEPGVAAGPSLLTVGGASAIGIGLLVSGASAYMLYEAGVAHDTVTKDETISAADATAAYAAAEERALYSAIFGAVGIVVAGLGAGLLFIPTE